MYSSGVLSNKKSCHCSTNYIELQLNVGMKGNEGFRELRESSLLVKMDAESVNILSNETEKNNQVVIMAEFKHPYLSTPKCMPMFNMQCSIITFPWTIQNCCYNVRDKQNSWTNNVFKTLHQTMYSKHCIRATTATVLYQAWLKE